MALWRKKDKSSRLQPDDPAAYNAVVSLIRTRLDATASITELHEVGLSEDLAARYLDLAMVIAARELLQKTENAVEFPASYVPMVMIPSLTSRFSACRITAELVGVFQAEPTAAEILGPFAADFFAVDEALQQGVALVRLEPPEVGDGAQVAFARITFGDAGVDKLAKSWPSLS